MLFKVGGVLSFSALPILGEQVMPIWLVGVLIGGESLVQLLLDVPAGFLLDRFGYKRLLCLTSLFIVAMGSVLWFFGLSQWTYVVMILLGGFGWLFFGPGVDAYALSVAPRAQTGRYMGMRRASNSLGATIGTVLLTLLLLQPTSIMGMAIALPALCAAIVVLFLRREKTSVHAEIKIETQHYYIRRTFLKETILAIKKLNPASGMLALSGFASATFYAVVWFVLPLFLKDLAHPGVLQFGLTIFDVTVILCGGLIGKLADSRNKRLYVFLGLLVFATFGMLTGFSLNGWFLVFGFMASVGDELSCVSLWAWMNHLNRDHAHDGLIASVISFFQDVGWVIGPVLAGFAYSKIGASYTMLVGSSFVFLSWMVSAIVLRRNITSVFHSSLPASLKPHRYAHKD